MVSSGIIPKSSFSSNGLSTEVGREGGVRERERKNEKTERGQRQFIISMYMFTYIENMLMGQFDSF